jgi:anti-sigma regulatory factor (Ser/Thr protein kinase)
MTAACSTSTAATAPWLLQTHLELGAYASAVPCARGHVRCVATEWGLRDLADTAELLASELVTNAINASQRLRTPETPVVRLWLVCDQISLVIHVWDGSKEMPVREEADADDLSGRGLMIIDTLSARWGSYQEPEGKVVWAMVSKGGSLDEGISG